MDMKARRMSLRDSFMGVLSRRSLVTRRTDRLKGVQLFRSAVRRVLLYMQWLTEVEPTEEIGDDVAINIRLAQVKKTEKTVLTVEVQYLFIIKVKNKKYILNHRTVLFC